MAKQRETRRQVRIRKKLEENYGGYWIKIWSGPFQRSGFPDLLGCVDGLFFAFEVKEDDGTVSEIQHHVMGEIRAAGGCTGVVIEYEDAAHLVDRAIRQRAKGRV